MCIVLGKLTSMIAYVFVLDSEREKERVCACLWDCACFLHYMIKTFFFLLAKFTHDETCKLSFIHPSSKFFYVLFELRVLSWILHMYELANLVTVCPGRVMMLWLLVRCES